jgi:hypothetical protein
LVISNGVVAYVCRDIKKRKSVAKEPRAKKSKAAKKATKAAKDPNAPKRPPTAFFIFL